MLLYDRQKTTAEFIFPNSPQITRLRHFATDVISADQHNGNQQTDINMPVFQNRQKLSRQQRVKRQTRQQEQRAGTLRQDGERETQVKDIYM